ncbi:MAG TPA: hypothetical protein VGV12_15690 [Gemmatimonadales bacterium]|nr:hypothetical protein [Gemmatimonadales bacterium]
MKTVSLGNVGLSLVGLYALAQALVLFPLLGTRGMALLDVGRQGLLLVAVVTILPFALSMLLGAILVANPALVARRLWPSSEEMPAVPEELALLVFAATGVVVFARALPDLVDASIAVLMTGRAGEARLQLLAGSLVRVALGLTLFFRPGDVLRFWRRRQRRSGDGAEMEGAA